MGNPRSIIVNEAAAQGRAVVNWGGTNRVAGNQIGEVDARPPIVLPQAQLNPANPAIHASINQYPLPNSFTISVASASGTGAAATYVYLFNRDYLNNATDNGSGAGSITYTYSDGFGGKVIDQIITRARAGVGAACLGLQLRLLVTSTAEGNAAGLNNTNPSFLTYNVFGSSLPLNFNITSDQTRKDFDTSVEVIRCAQNITRFTQFRFLLPVNNTASVTFYFMEDFSI